MAKKLKGIRKHRGAWEVSWTGSDGKTAYKRFPEETPEPELLKFRKDQIARVQLSPKIQERGSFEYEMDQYLATLKGRKKKDAGYQLATWRREFKGRRLQTITTAEINQVLLSWQSHKEDPTLLRQRSSLMSMFNKRAPDLKPNPVSEAISFSPRTPERRAIDLGIVRRLLTAAPWGKSKARFAMPFYFGCRPSEVARIKPERDIKFSPDGKTATVYISSADEGAEGKGTSDRLLNASGAQLDILRMLVESGGAAGKRYSTPSIRSSMLRWAKKAGIQPSELMEEEVTRSGRIRYRIRPYDMRHTFLTELRKVSDLGATALAAGHKDLRTTRRYAPGEDSEVTIAMAKSAIHQVEVLPV